MRRADGVRTEAAWIEDRGRCSPGSMMEAIEAGSASGSLGPKGWPNLTTRMLQRVGLAVL